MAHSSLPIYLDPSNWQQQSNQHPTNDHQDPRQLPQFLPPPPSQPPHISGVAGSIRPGSMAYRARLAMIPQPEAALKCPRCESTNTKFCYFNNYSLSQPRHFCKTCRRYWTRGGALRNVPVGGGFRKNKKKKKSNRSKSPAATEMEMMNNSRSNSTIMSAGCNIGSGTIGHLATQSLQLPSMAASLQINLPRFGSGNNSGSGLNLNGIQIGGELDQWRSQQYPFIVAGLESPSAAGYSLIPNEATFGGNNNNNTSTVQYCHQVQNLTPPFCSERERESHQLKNEEKQNQNQNLNQAGIPNFLRPPAAIVTTENNNNQFWTSHDQSSWTDLSALSSSSSSHLL